MPHPEIIPAVHKIIGDDSGNLSDLKGDRTDLCDAVFLRQLIKGFRYVGDNASFMHIRLILPLLCLFQKPCFKSFHSLTGFRGYREDFNLRIESSDPLTQFIHIKVKIRQRVCL